MRNIVFFSVCVLVLSGCSRDLSTTETGTLVGSGVGAGMGAVVGGAIGSAGPGIAIGGVAGAGVGGLIGQEAENQEARTLQMQEIVRRQDEELKRQEREIQDLRHQRGLNRELSGYAK